MGAVGTKQFGITFFQFLNKNLPDYVTIVAEYFSGVFLCCLNFFHRGRCVPLMSLPTSILFGMPQSN